MDVVSFKAEMHNKLVDRIIYFIFSVEIVIHHSVWLGLRIGDYQSFSDC